MLPTTSTSTWSTSPVKTYNNTTKDDSGCETTDVTESVVSTATVGPTLVESPTTAAGGLISSSALQPETLNIPAVLWDRPVGSSKRVPPPVPPRSPRRPIDHLASFAAASASHMPEGRGVPIFHLRQFQALLILLLIPCFSSIFLHEFFTLYNHPQFFSVL